MGFSTGMDEKGLGYRIVGWLAFALLTRRTNWPDGRMNGWIGCIVVLSLPLPTLLFYV